MNSVRSSKSVFSSILFMLAVIDNPHKLHCIAGRSSSIINNNFLTGELGLVTLYPDLCSVTKDKVGGYYLRIGDNKIILVSYDNKSSWKGILGQTIGIFLIDECNIAHQQFLKESFARQVSIEKPLTILTTNGDSPNHKIYSNYINYGKPFTDDVPTSILNELSKYENKYGYIYTHWTLKDNPIMTIEKIEAAKSLYPVGSVYYINKILGERVNAEGSIFVSAINENNIIKDVDVNLYEYQEFTIGVDVGATDGTVFTLIGKGHGKLCVVDILSHKNNPSGKQFGSIDYLNLLFDFYVKWYDILGRRLEMVAIDSANKAFRISFMNMLYERNYNTPVNKSTKRTIKQRVDYLIMLLNTNKLLINEKCVKLIEAIYDVSYSNKATGDMRVEDSCLDFIDSLDYSIAPYFNEIL